MIRAEIDRLRCKGTGVCIGIAPDRLKLVDGIAQPITASGLAAEEAQAAVECCPNEAIRIVEEPDGGAMFRVSLPIVTLGPPGTDAEAEAAKHTNQVTLCNSFPEAMSAAAAGDVLALIAAGYIERDGDFTVDSWSDQHFTHHRQLRIVRLWETRTKPMCLAIRRGVPALTDVRATAVHPATAALLEMCRVPGRRIFVNSKPRAADAAARGEVDACIASTDVVAALPELRIVERFDPTMVWMLYQRRTGRER